MSRSDGRAQNRPRCAPQIVQRVFHSWPSESEILALCFPAPQRHARDETASNRWRLGAARLRLNPTRKLHRFPGTICGKTSNVNTGAALLTQNTYC